SSDVCSSDLPGTWARWPPARTRPGSSPSGWTPTCSCPGRREPATPWWHSGEFLRTCVRWVLDFSDERNRDRLRVRDARMRSGGPFVAHSTRHLVVARRPDGTERATPRPRSGRVARSTHVRRQTMHGIWGIGGMAGLLLIATALSTNRKAIRLRTVLPALAIQVAFGGLVLFVPWGRDALAWLSEGFQGMINSTNEGIAFLFGPLLPEEGDGSIFALQVLPVIVFFASLTAVLYHVGVLQRVVGFIGGGLQRLLGTGKAESTNAAANIFVGQTEAPLVIRPYIAGLTNSALFAVM